MSMPSNRGLSTTEVPQLGGLAILIGVVVAAAIWLPATIKLAPTPHGRPGAAGVVHTWWILAGALLIALVGAVDDVKNLKPLPKLIGQIAAAVVAVEGGAVINDLTIPFVGPMQFPHGGGTLTVLWLVAMMNIVNFSDGVDGLAAGVCTIDGIAFAIIAFDLQGGHSNAAVLAALTAGGALGFLVHNFPPAKIFMGDIGANLLGYLLGLAAVVGSLKTGAVLALAVPLLILAVPLLDTGFVVAKRLKYGRKPWEADDWHFHHRFRNLGFSQRRTILYLYGWSAVMAGAAVLMRIVTHDHPHQFWWIFLLCLLLALALAASVYLVWVLEILKFKGLRAIQLRSQDPDTTEHEIIVTVERDIETGEFDKVRK
ncbi:MAG: undecaprenyl/decaprenyl-phosphate alpha-N-acetylglucosaminyl 1-phosphate transferase [Solirubrobacterales bacterium]|nr:undecaprenyl/decaprenyl-phosphate alpha-N-acetylglucosaminyl 1-phosphate transferase [Solirubrobacterales bacterium]